MQDLWVRCAPKMLGVHWQEGVSQQEYAKLSSQHGFISQEMPMRVPGLHGSGNCIFRAQSLCLCKRPSLAAPTSLVPKPLAG